MKEKLINIVGSNNRISFQTTNLILKDIIKMLEKIEKIEKIKQLRKQKYENLYLQ